LLPSISAKLSAYSAATSFEKPVSTPIIPRKPEMERISIVNLIQYRFIKNSCAMEDTQNFDKNITGPVHDTITSKYYFPISGIILFWYNSSGERKGFKAISAIIQLLDKERGTEWGIRSKLLCDERRPQPME